MRYHEGVYVVRIVRLVNGKLGLTISRQPIDAKEPKYTYNRIQLMPVINKFIALMRNE